MDIYKFCEECVKLYKYTNGDNINEHMCNHWHCNNCLTKHKNTNCYLCVLDRIPLTEDEENELCELCIMQN